MGLDIRLPIGLLFSVIGVLLVGFGVLGDKSVYQAFSRTPCEPGLGCSAARIRCNHVVPEAAHSPNSSRCWIVSTYRRPRPRVSGNDFARTAADLSTARFHEMFGMTPRIFGPRPRQRDGRAHQPQRRARDACGH